MSDAEAILTMNAGSSSLKLGLFNRDASRMIASVLAERIGTADASLSMKTGQGGALALPAALIPDHAAALVAGLAALKQQFPGTHVAAVGHRVVHGGPDFAAPAVLTPQILAKLHSYAPFAPLHQPHNLAGIAAAMAAFPRAVQIACFDTGFHRGQPWENDTYALPRRYYDKGIRRYGFHGLSYQHVSGELARLAPELAKGRVIIAHLGNGASMCALLGGRSIGSTMGFSTLDGLAMGTRSGQIDPGVLLYLLEQDGLTVGELSDLLYRQSGLLGLSGLSNDMRELAASDDPAAGQAISYFCTRVRREIGSLAAALGGLDGLIFTGGIGEHAGAIRAQVCDGMGWIGIALDPARNATAARVLSPEGAVVTVMVIPTDEERVIARAMASALALG